MNSSMIAAYTVSLFCIYLAYLRCKRINLDHIPALGHSNFLLSYLDLPSFKKRGVQMIDEAYKKYPGHIFKIPFMSHWGVVVSNPRLIDEVKNAKDSDLSFRLAASEILQKRFTLGPALANASFHVEVVRSTLTRNIASLFEDIRDEIVEAFGEYIPVRDNHDWVPIVPLVTMSRIVCRISNRLFLGLPICRDPDWIDLNTRFTVDVFEAAQKIKKFPDFLKPIAGYFYSPYAKAYKRAYNLIGSLVEERLRLHGEEEGPNDLITWLIDGAPEESRNVESIVMMILLVNLAAIHTSSNAFSHALFRLASSPSHVEPMREEVIKVVDELGWTKASMTQLRKVDSFMRESQRSDGLGTFNVSRVVSNPRGFTFSDGTHLPAGTTILVPTHAIHSDSTLYEDPETFKGFRFSEMREGVGREGRVDGEAVKHQMVNAGPTNYAFGSGRHTCPGRFFAANELKAMLAHVVLNYDLKLEEESSEPYQAILSGFRIIPSMKKILWRKSKV